jgi:heme oxygenase (biliverdin-IX-beta and delta-forming)
MAEDLGQDNYVACLQLIHGVVAAWEQQASEKSPQNMQAFFSARQRTPMLERDLAWFGASHPSHRRPLLPEMNDNASLLGAMYVMEGSTLGGQYIARHVERVLGLTDGNGDAYFRGYEQQTGSMWKESCEMLRTAIPDCDAAIAIDSAKAMFAAFGSWMRQCK